MLRRIATVFFAMTLLFFTTCSLLPADDASEEYKDIITTELYNTWYFKKLNEPDLRVQGFSNRGGVYAWGWGYLGSSLIDMYRVTGDDNYLELFISKADFILTQRNNELGRVNYTGTRLILPSWSDNGNYSESGNFIYTYPVHTAMIVIPMLQFVRVVQVDGLVEYEDKARYYLEACGNALSYHDNTWVDFSDEEGYYFGHPYGKGEVAESGLEGIPNRVHIYLAACGLYDHLAGTSIYTERIRKAFRYFKNNLLHYDPEFDAYYWSYWNQSGVSNWEDISHAFLTIYAIQTLQYDAGFNLFTHEEMQKFANIVYKIVDESDPPMVRKHIHQRPGEGNPYYSLQDNEYYEHAFRWSLLSRVDSMILDRTLPLYSAIYGSTDFKIDIVSSSLKDLSINISSLTYLSTEPINKRK